MESETREARESRRERQASCWLSEGVTASGWAKACSEEVCCGVAEEEEWSSGWQEVRADKESWRTPRWEEYQDLTWGGRAGSSLIS